MRFFLGALWIEISFIAKKKNKRETELMVWGFGYHPHAQPTTSVEVVN
jgi:hypothetical protein